MNVSTRAAIVLGLAVALVAGTLACGKAEGAAETSSTTGHSESEMTAPTDCPRIVADLPDSKLYQRTDKRLTRGVVVVVLKKQRRLMLFSGGRLATVDGMPACFRVGLGQGAPTGHKQREGDMRTPEGWYRTSDKPTSQWYGAIAIHYPNVEDARRGLSRKAIDRATYRRIVDALARDRKPPQRTALGGDLLIHGGGNASDWTLGCVAMANPRLDLLRDALPAGLQANVLILP